MFAGSEDRVNPVFGLQGHFNRFQNLQLLHLDIDAFILNLDTRQLADLLVAIIAAQYVPLHVKITLRPARLSPWSHPDSLADELHTRQALADALEHAILKPGGARNGLVLILPIIRETVGIHGSLLVGILQGQTVAFWGGSSRATKNTDRPLLYMGASGIASGMDRQAWLLRSVGVLGNLDALQLNDHDVAEMPDLSYKTPYPLIDSDPHFTRVVKYFRPSDYAVWGAGAAAFPGLLYAYELADPSDARRLPRGLTPALRLATVLGVAGGFLIAYQRSTKRFWGWEENEREQKRDLEELSTLAKEGKPLYGETDLPEYLQGVAHRNSVWSQLKLGTLPWFNVVNHKHHGVDTSKYTQSSDQ